MAAASLFPDVKIFGELDVEQHQLSDTSHQIPDGVMAELDIPGYTWLYLTVPNTAKPGGNLTLIKGVGKATARRPQPEHQAKTQTGHQERPRQTTQLSADREKKFNLNTAKGFLFKLPHILLTNAHSLLNKVEDLRYRLKTDAEIQSCELMCFTETWLTEPPRVDVQGYQERHSVRSTNKTRKKRGGGLGILIKDGVNVQVVAEKQNPNYQFLGFKYESENLPEGTPPLIFMLAYIQPGAKRKITRQKLERSYCHAERWSNGGPVFILGDFNWYDNFLENSSDPTVYQYVTCPTRRTKTLDRCFGNIPQAYTSQCRSPLRSTNTQSDHNVILLTPERKNCSHSQW